MAEFKPVTITRGSFAFCRATIAVLLWASIIFKANWLVVMVFLIMLFSAILKVAHAPLILLYKYTIDKIRPSENVIVDEKGIFVSHVVGAVFAALCIFLLYFERGIVSLIVTVMFAVLQTSAAFGFCSALKLYTCMSGGNCCRIGKFAKKVKNRNA
ncbi:MAG: DUF4395 family protein [Bacillota bacterium]|nr:DUF4395 family protein [Bacillota bacterium]